MRSVANLLPPGRWRARLRMAVAVCVVLLASAVAGTPVSSAPGAVAGEPTSLARPTPGTLGHSVPRPGAQSVPGAPSQSVPDVPAREGDVVLLQMNLCNSGMAVSCYSFGRAVDEAAAKIREYSPDLLMVQEVCRDDLYARGGWGKLAQAMADLYGRDRISVNFVPARNRYTGRPYRCVNGEQFGVALVHHGDGRGPRHGWYRSQDGSDETRAWTCTTVIQGRLTGCTTHQSTDPGVAMRQCKELISILASPWVMPQVVVAGDLNLVAAPGQAYDVNRCAPADYDVRGDGAVQQVFFSNGIQWAQGGIETMKFTDHPMLFERLRLGP